jgi:hypothetical protein
MHLMRDNLQRFFHTLLKNTHFLRADLTLSRFSHFFHGSCGQTNPAIEVLYGPMTPFATTGMLLDC